MATDISGVFISASAIGNLSEPNYQFRVYHRHEGQESWGYFDVGKDPRGTGSYGSFDGKHLVIHFTGRGKDSAFDLNFNFDSALQRWVGDWLACNATGRAVLERPRRTVESSANPFIGNWESAPDPVTGTTVPGSLHFQQSSDGRLFAWLDRELGKTEKRNGEELTIVSMTTDSIVLQTNNAVNTDAQYHGKLSNDGKVLIGEWDAGLGRRLTAPMRFQLIGRD